MFFFFSFHQADGFQGNNVKENKNKRQIRVIDKS